MTLPSSKLSRFFDPVDILSIFLLVYWVITRTMVSLLNVGCVILHSWSCVVSFKYNMPGKNNKRFISRQLYTCLKFVSKDIMCNLVLLRIYFKVAYLYSHLFSTISPIETICYWSCQKEDISHYYLSPIIRDSKHWVKRNLLIFSHLIQIDIIKFLYSIE